MRRWDGAYPVLSNGTKAVDLKGAKVRCAWLSMVSSIPLTITVCQVRATQVGPILRVLVLQVLLRSVRRTSVKAQ